MNFGIPLVKDPKPACEPHITSGQSSSSPNISFALRISATALVVENRSTKVFMLDGCGSSVEEREVVESKVGDAARITTRSRRVRKRARRVGETPPRTAMRPGGQDTTYATVELGTV